MTGVFALSGSVTNWIAVHMLFDKVPFLYGSGVILDRFEDIKLGLKKPNTARTIFRRSDKKVSIRK